jgi:hypothetical protein
VQQSHGVRPAGNSQQHALFRETEAKFPGDEAFHGQAELGVNWAEFLEFEGHVSFNS